LRHKTPKRRFFVYRIEDKTKFTNPVKSEAAARRSKTNLQKHFNHELAVGWEVINPDGQLKNTEYPT